MLFFKRAVYLLAVMIITVWISCLFRSWCFALGHVHQLHFAFDGVQENINWRHELVMGLELTTAKNIYRTWLFTRTISVLWNGFDSFVRQVDYNLYKWCVLDCFELPLLNIKLTYGFSLWWSLKAEEKRLHLEIISCEWIRRGKCVKIRFSSCEKFMCSLLF